MKRINYKSDFDFILRLKDCADPKKTVPFPEGDFDARFWTSNKANAYTASCRDGVYTNCFRTEDGGMHFVFDDHRMGKGALHWEPHFKLPNDIYPDNMQDLYRKAALDIELVDGNGDCPTTAEVEAMLPYIKGEPLTYEDFTPEQIEELQRPATEAAEKLDGFVQTASEAESVREANEKVRVGAEQTRVVKETERQTKEATRQSHEAQRIEAETDREEAENERVSAENARAEEFAAWQDEIDSKADRTELSNIVGQPTEGELEALEPTLVNTALRKVPQALTPEEQAQVKENIGVSKLELFVDMWNQAWGEYGGYDPENAPDAQHPFMGNEIWMTYEEAIAVMHHSVIYAPSQQNLYSHKHPPCRTLLPTMAYGYAEEYNGTYGYCNKLETIRIRGGYGGESVGIKNAQSAFMVCTVLREVFGILDLAQCSTPQTPADKATNLEGLYISHLHVDLNMATNPKWRLDCVEFVVENAANTSAITITLHPDAYARLTDGLIASAAAKNINFATV